MESFKNVWWATQTPKLQVHFQFTVKAGSAQWPKARQQEARTRTHLVSGDRDPSEDAPWYTLWDNLLSGLSSLSYAIIFHSWRLFLAFLTFFTSRVVPSIRFCSWRPGKESKHAKTEGRGKRQLEAVTTHGKQSCSAVGNRSPSSHLPLWHLPKLHASLTRRTQPRNKHSLAL